MATVVISPFNVVNFLNVGGHFWVYMQYAQALQRLGCDVYWLEKFRSSADEQRDRSILDAFRNRMERWGLHNKFILYTNDEPLDETGNARCNYIGVTQAEAEAVFRKADLLMNFHYSISPALLSCFRRTALVDIDPGLLQFWISTGQLIVPRHDLYLTIGETVGTPAAKFADCGVTWNHIRPIVCLELWPSIYDPDAKVFTTISSWWSGASGGEYLVNGDEIYDNNKRVSFLKFLNLPHKTRQPLELALFLSEHDSEDQHLLEGHGWIIRHSLEVARTPEMYQAYVQTSRGEFSCVKPSCVRFQNAWMSDRTLCYLASGKPAVVQHTGQSAFLPNGQGLFRFTNIDEATEALATINSDYRRHCLAARELAETYFDAAKNVEEMLRMSL
jgi:hypothetical protein